MSLFALKPTHAPVKAYYAALAQFHLHGHKTEGNTRSAFADLLKKCCSPYDWHLVEEYQFKGTGKQPLRADGALVDSLTLVHGLWEAKDSADDLEREIKAKVARGYPLTNILFQSPNRAVLYQDNRIALDCSLSKPENLVEILQLFFEHRQPHEVDWEEAVFKFAEKIPDLAQGVTKILNDEYAKNKEFQERFKAFAELCRQSINPSLTDEAIQKMLVQHLLTERVFRKVFNNNEFLQRNVIAAEIEKVIQSITAKHFSRDTFLKPLDRFYTAIEKAAESQTGYTEKQHFLNAVYEKFFQSFDKKQADTHGIVYTPQPIVDFMVRSVEEILKTEFGKSLSDEGVHILDPFTGTGNFITRIMQSIKKSRLPHKYAHELHCNEVMLLPYYIASMNIEHAYSEAMKAYQPFDGICLVDTFELAEADQGTLFTTENTQRVKKQKQVPVHVVIGNPPYNAWKSDEAKSDKNRPYKNLQKRTKDTFAALSSASLLISLNDPYVNAYRWASDRIGKEGIVAFVSNSSFLDSIATDGMRASLQLEFDEIYLVDLGGNIRQNPKLSGTTHNVFGIQVGVVIALLVRRNHQRKRQAKIRYFSVGTEWKRSAKLNLLTSESQSSLKWRTLKPNERHDWLTDGLSTGFKTGIPMTYRKRKEERVPGEPALFSLSSSGVKTNRDSWVYNFDQSQLERDIESTITFYNSEVDRLRRIAQQARPRDLAPAVQYAEESISWSDDLRTAAGRGIYATYSVDAIRGAIYRPFTRQHLYFDRLFNNSVYLLERIYPANPGNVANPAIWVKTGGDWPFFALAVSGIADVLPQGGSQLFPFFYSEDGVMVDNITDVLRGQYRTHYADKKITKWDIFHSTYALLHHPEYRTRYAANLKRELPRIPFPPDLHAFAEAGKRLMELHIDYEKQPEYPLEEIEIPKVPWTLRVERMRLSRDKTELRYNRALTLRGIPPAAFNYRLGNRSALEWVIDQYQVSTDKRSGITNDPNRPDDERYILRLIGQVITVSLETEQIIADLPSLNLDKVP